MAKKPFGMVAFLRLAKLKFMCAVFVIYSVLVGSQIFYYLLSDKVRILKIGYFLKSSGNVAIAFYPFILISKSKTIAYDKEDFKKLLYHEYTHIKQQKELLFIFAFFLYLLEWAIKRDYNKISFEREARYFELPQNQKELEKRKPFNFIKYL